MEWIGFKCFYCEFWTTEISINLHLYAARQFRTEVSYLSTIPNDMQQNVMATVMCIEFLKDLKLQIKRDAITLTSLYIM